MVVTPGITGCLHWKYIAPCEAFTSLTPDLFHTLVNITTLLRTLVRSPPSPPACHPSDRTKIEVGSLEGDWEQLFAA
jgi:hypothetical protein